MMNAPTVPVSDDELHAFVDGQLDDERLAAVLQWLQAHPDAATRVAQWQTQRQQLRRLARSLPMSKSPPILAERVLRSAGRARRRAGWQQTAAAGLLLAIGVGAGHWCGAAGPAHQPLAASPAFVRDAVLAHAVFVPEKRHPVEVAAADQAHLVQWLSKRLGVPLKAPLLEDRGYRLLGGRLLPGEDKPRAQFMYENGEGRRITLYVTVFSTADAPGETSFRSLRDGERESFYWVEDRFGYALSGELSASDLQLVAREVHAQLTR